MRFLIAVLLFAGCARDKGATPPLSDCRFITVEEYEFERVGRVNANVYECVRGIQTCNVYVAVTVAAMSTNCKE